MSATPPPLRSSEKRRTSTCLFADMVAMLVVDLFRKVAKENAHVDLGGGREDGMTQTVVAGIVLGFHDCIPAQFECVALGSGTKVVHDQVLDNDQTTLVVVADMHAEVLARRSFMAFLYDELEALVAGSTKKRNVFIMVDGKPMFRKDVSIHFYTSSAPCGNSCVRRWAKSPGQEVFDAKLDCNSWPMDQKHPKFHPQSKDEGQCAVLCKSMPNPAVVASEKRAKISNENPFPPPGTSLPRTTTSSSRASCSDKMARWCAVGLEGALITSLLSPQSPPHGICPTTITIGRKFCRPHVERALCCRLGTKVWDHRPHPTIMCTAVKLNENGYDAERGASFVDACLTWWASCENPTKGEVLDGKTGLRLGDGGPPGTSRARLWTKWLSLGGNPNSSNDNTFLMQYTDTKRHAAPGRYVANVDDLLSHVLVDWPRWRWAVV